MFVFLSKIIPPLVYPLGLAIFLLAAALLLRKRPRLRSTAEILALLLLLVFSSRWVSFGLARSLEWQYLPTEVPSADVIVLLGGATESADPPRTQPQLNGAGDRLMQAARLYRAHKAPAILVSGGTISWLSGTSSTPAQDMQVLLAEMGIPVQAIWLEDQSQNTYENALYCARILREKNISRIILVTSAVHMPRSVALFKKQGIEVIPAPANFAVTDVEWQDLYSSPGSFLLNLLPSASSLSTTSSVLKEYLGILIYGLRGWL